MASSVRSTSPERLDEAGKAKAFAVCVGVAALTILDLNKVNVGLPSIETSLHAGSTALQLIVAGYALAFGLMLVPAGRLGDVHSRRTLFVVGLAGFAVASLFCALAPNIGALVGARILQGFFAGVQMPQVLGLIQQLYQGPTRSRRLGIFGATVGLATAIGPTFGGLLIQVGGETSGWRLLFWVNIPLAAIAILAALRWLPGRSDDAPDHAALDPVGIVFLGLTILLLMAPFLLTTGGSTDTPLRWLLLVPAAGAALGLVLWERRYRNRGQTPIVDFQLFRRTSYRNGILLATAYFAAIPASFLLTTLLLQNGLQLKPVFAGMVSIPFALTSAFSAWIGGRLVDRVGRSLVVGGVLIAMGGFALVLAGAEFAPRDLVPWAMAGGMFVAGLGGGLVVAPNQALTLSDVPVRQAGVAGSIGQVGQRVGTAIGVAAATAGFYSALSAEKGQGVTRYLDGFRAGMLVTIGLMALALILGLLDLVGRARRRSEDADGEASDGAAPASTGSTATARG